MPTTETTHFKIEPGTSHIESTRYFDSSPDKVFRACTDRDLIAQWWGPRRYETVIDEFEPQRGGKWRMVHRDDDGNEYGFNGVFHQVVDNERIVQTFEFEGMPGHVCLEQMDLIADGDGTRMQVVSAFTSVADRDGMAESGMQEGASESHDRLQELLDTLD